ncbi:hypothetical protein, partial [Pusillimonas sp. T2]|uniref:hypothetical protein n=1 Tax=Pusillimonas sp. T2 TaxID=1548123 RepID=UPI001C1FE3CB
CQSGVWRGPGIGSAQSWQNVTGSRGNNVGYQNTTSRPIQVSIYVQSSAANSVFVIDGQIRSYFLGTAANEVATFTLIIPVGSIYYLSAGGSITMLSWHELR